MYFLPKSSLSIDHTGKWWCWCLLIIVFFVMDSSLSSLHWCYFVMLALLCIRCINEWRWHHYYMLMPDYVPSAKEKTTQMKEIKNILANFSLNCWWRQVFPQCSGFSNFISSSIIWYLYTGRAVQNSSLQNKQTHKICCYWNTVAVEFKLI